MCQSLLIHRSVKFIGLSVIYSNKCNEAKLVKKKKNSYTCTSLTVFSEAKGEPCFIGINKQRLQWQGCIK